MSGSDDEELASLRAARAAKMGSAGLTVTSLRGRLQQHQLRGGEDGDADEDGPTVVAAEEAKAGPPPPSRQQQSGEDAEDGEGEEDGMAGLRTHFPVAFGGGKLQRQIAQQERQRQAQQQKQQWGPPRPPPKAPAASAAVEEEDGGAAAAAAAAEAAEQVGQQTLPGSREGVAGSEEEDGEAGEGREQQRQVAAHAQRDPYRLPISHEASLEGHDKAVTALDLDHSGSRLLAGGHDYKLRIFDFGGMKSDMRAFRTLEPCEGHPVVALSWSPTGDAFLCVTGSPQPKVYDREGKEQGEFVRGDMYIRDMKNTKGHVSGCSGGQWHPQDKGQAITSSDDGTVRVWDMWELVQRTVIKPTLARPGRVAVTACAYSTDGRLIGGGLMDGTLQLWDVKGKFGQSAAVGVVPQPKAQMVAKQTWSYVSGTNQLVRGAHAPASEITCLKFSLDGNNLLTRGADETLKVWDLRKFKSPLVSFEDLPNHFSSTQCCFSPDESLILTCISADKQEEGGGVVFFDRQELKLVRRLAMPGSAVALQWHPKLNQIFVGCGGRKSGVTKILYDPVLSQKGALLAAARKPRAANPFDFQASAPVIYNPNALPMFREPFPTKKRKHVSDPTAASKARKPEVGDAVVKGVGAGGRLGTTGGTLLTQYVLKQQGVLRNPKEEDVRLSILRHAGKEDEFNAFTAAYAATQPQRIFAVDEEEEEEEDVGPQPPPQA